MASIKNLEDAFFFCPFHQISLATGTLQGCGQKSAGMSKQYRLRTTYLPEYKVFSDDGLNSVITPNIPVQTLAGKVLNVLNVDH